MDTAKLIQPSELLAEANVLIRAAKALRDNPFVQQLRAREHPGVHQHLIGRRTTWRTRKCLPSGALDPS